MQKGGGSNDIKRKYIEERLERKKGKEKRNDLLIKRKNEE